MKISAALHRNPISSICLISAVAQTGCLYISNYIYNVYPVPNIFMLALWLLCAFVFWKKKPAGGWPMSNVLYYPSKEIAEQALNVTMNGKPMIELKVGDVIVPIDGRIKYLITKLSNNIVYASPYDGKDRHHSDIQITDINKFQKVN